MAKKETKRGSGGAILFKTRGKEYFSELAKKGWEQRREAKILWEKQQKKLAKGATGRK